MGRKEFSHWEIHLDQTANLLQSYRKDGLEHSQFAFQQSTAMVLNRVKRVARELARIPSVENAMPVSVVIPPLLRSNDAQQQYRAGAAPPDPKDTAEYNIQLEKTAGRPSPLKPFARVLNEIDPAIVNRYIMNEAFGVPRDDARISRLAPFIELLGRLSFSQEISPGMIQEITEAGQLILLSQLDITIKRHMLTTLNSSIEKYKGQAQNSGVQKAGNPEQIMAYLLVGNKNYKKGIASSAVWTERASYNGALYYLGMLHKLQTHLYSRARQIWPPKETDIDAEEQIPKRTARAILILEAVLSRELKVDAKGRKIGFYDSQDGILRELFAGNIESAADSLKVDMKDNRDKYPPDILRNPLLY